MPTNYPGAIDTPVDPLATDQMNSPTVPHATQHANVNDAVVAIETAIGTTAAPLLQLVIDAVVTGATAAPAANHYVPIDTTAQSCIVTLPNAPADRTRCGVKMVTTASAHTVTVNCAGSDVFNKVGGATSASIILANQAMLFEYTLATHIWTVISDDLTVSSLDGRYAVVLPRQAVVTGATAAPAANTYVPIDTTTQSCVVTLPTAPANNTLVALKMITTAGGHIVTFNTGGSDVFNKAGGATTGTLSLLAQGAIFQYDLATAIWTITADDLPLSQLDARYAQLAAATNTFTGNLSAVDVFASTEVAAPLIVCQGIAPANTASYWAGGTTGGAPASGTWIAGEWIVDITGKIFICTVGGTPGTWLAVDSTDLKLAGGTMSGPIAMGTSKITGLGNGSAAQDAVAFGQIPVVPGGGSPAPSLALGASQSTSFTAAANTLYPCSATLTATLPVAPVVGTVIGVYRSAVSAGITFAAGAGGTINGLASVSITNTSLLVDPLILVQATSSTTWVIISAVGTDGGQGFAAGGALKSVGQLSFNVGLVGHVIQKSALYTTLNTDWWVQCTSGSFTLTLGTTSFAAGFQQIVTNPGSGTITIAAASGTYVGPTTLPPGSGAMFEYDGTNWNCSGSWGLYANSAAFATVTTQAVVSGSVFTPSTTADNELLIPVTLAGTITMTMGPSTGAENALLTTQPVVAGTVITKCIPAGWKVVITLVTATLGTVTKQPVA